MVEHQRRHRGSHATLVVLGERALEDGTVGCANRRAHPIGNLVVREPPQRAELPGHEAHRHLTRHFAGGVPAHPVRDDEDPPVGDHEIAVLVARTDDADVGAASAGDMHGPSLGEQAVEDCREPGRGE